jgi:hypothetical protein
MRVLSQTRLALFGACILAARHGAAEPAGTIATDWSVDFASIAASTKDKLRPPARGDILVVRLKLDPAGVAADAKPLFLAGASAGGGVLAVGMVDHPLGKGGLSGVIGYVAKTDLVDVAVTPVPANGQDRAKLARVGKEVRGYVTAELASRGDLQAIAREAQERFAAKWPDRKLSVTVSPFAAMRPAYVMRMADYEVKEPTSFTVRATREGDRPHFVLTANPKP